MEKALDKNLEIAKKIIMEEVEKAGYEVERIILFGSRARGDYKEGRLVIIPIYHAFY